MAPLSPPACEHPHVLRSVEISFRVHDPAGAGDRFHNLHWGKTVELSVDCFVCGRRGRTTRLVWGEESGTCSGDSQFPSHPAPVRLSSFDGSHEDGQLVLRAVVDLWSAPFVDRRDGEPSGAMADPPWARVGLGYLCPDRDLQPHEGVSSLQTNLVLPLEVKCGRCDEAIAHMRVGSSIRLRA